MESAATTEEWYAANLDSITDITGAISTLWEIIDLEGIPKDTPLSEDGRALISEQCTVLAGFANVSRRDPQVPEAEDQERWISALDSWSAGASLCLEAMKDGDQDLLGDAVGRLNDGSASLVAMDVG